MTMLDAYATLKTGILWASYAASNPGEVALLDQYAADVAAGKKPAMPSLATKTGQGVAGLIAASAPVASGDVADAVRALGQADDAYWAAYNRMRGLVG